jgi:hypothetical protein
MPATPPDRLPCIIHALLYNPMYLVSLMLYHLCIFIFYASCTKQGAVLWIVGAVPRIHKAILNVMCSHRPLSEFSSHFLLTFHSVITFSRKSAGIPCHFYITPYPSLLSGGKDGFYSIPGQCLCILHVVNLILCVNEIIC